MSNNNPHLETLQDIKQLMEKSSRFISLSGLSGIAAGICGLVSAFIAHQLIESYYTTYNNRGHWDLNSFKELETKLFLLGMATMALAAGLGFYFTWRKAKQNNVNIFNSSSQRLFINICIPLAAGGIFIIGMLANNVWAFIGPACLIFYGLALINGSKYTLGEIRYLGILEIVLGGINLFYVGYGIYFWAVGFGILHIIYGIIMWNKYERS
ncbi:MAG: hypothetical protein ACOVNY_06995 [Chitinophagaceae bacterium]